MFGPTHANHATLTGSRPPSASFSSVKPMVLSHPLSLLFVVANSRQENYSFFGGGEGELNPNGLLALRFFVKTYVITFRFTSSATLMRHLAPYLHLHYTILDFVCQEVF